MAIPLLRQIDAQSRVPFLNAAPATAAGHLVEYAQWLAGQANMSWKDSVRAASTVNLTLTAPGATIDSVTMVSGDRFLAKDQTTQTQNGIYIWNGAATAATRAGDATDFPSLEAAVVMVEEGTSNTATTWRQTQVNGTIGTNNVIFAAFGTSAPAASETTSGIAEIATQAETDTGTDDLRIVTPLKLATYAGKAKRFSQDIGDGSTTSIAVTHNLGTLDVEVYVREVGGAKRAVLVEAQHTSTTVVTLLFDVAPTAAQYRVTVIA